ncbi:MAG: magnesium chelatase [Thermoanaerobacterales bacterium]|nr:magnesium chelatase [Thermoanaerobacterales bacterium]
MKRFSHLIRHPGNTPLFDIIDISILGALQGTPVHFHVEGLRGTGKTTIIRASKQILPKIKRIKGCIFNCDPDRPQCPEHKYLSKKEINQTGIEVIEMPFLEISPGAKKGTIAGSIDIKKLLSRQNPEAAILLGTIPKANRGIIFVDEINRIADISPEIVDMLLDVMGTKPGRIQIEEIGFPVFDIRVQVCVWAASNPDEDPGPLEDIRKQLSDRFDFTIDVERPQDVDVIKSILDFKEQSIYDEKSLEHTSSILAASDIVKGISYPEEIKDLLASLYVDFGIESLRGVEAILLGVKLRAAFMKRNPNIDDVLVMTKYSLKHRTDTKLLNEILKNIEQTKKEFPHNKQLFSSQSENIAVPTLPDESQNNAINAFKDKYESPLSKLYSYLKKGFRFNFNHDNKKTTSNFQGIKVKAPCNKAIHIRELSSKEYVKTEEELNK